MIHGLPHYFLLTATLAACLGKKRAWIVLPISLLFWIPLQPHLIGLVRGAVGELSVGSWILTVLLILKVTGERPIKDHPGIKQTAALITIVGALLYGNFIGILPLGSFYPYESAFTSPLTLLSICLFAAFASWKGWLWPALWSILSLLVWKLKLHPSLNPWDSLLDPILWIFSIIFLIRSSRS